MSKNKLVLSEEKQNTLVALFKAMHFVHHKGKYSECVMSACVQSREILCSEEEYKLVRCLVCGPTIAVDFSSQSHGKGKNKGKGKTVQEVIDGQMQNHNGNHKTEPATSQSPSHYPQARPDQPEDNARGDDRRDEAEVL